METRDATVAKLQELPEPLLEQVNDFIDFLVDRDRREQRRAEIHANFLEAQVEERNGDLKFSADLTDLRRSIEE